MASQAPENADVKEVAAHHEHHEHHESLSNEDEMDHQNNHQHNENDHLFEDDQETEHQDGLSPDVMCDDARGLLENLYTNYENNVNLIFNSLDHLMSDMKQAVDDEEAIEIAIMDEGEERMKRFEEVLAKSSLAKKRLNKKASTKGRKAA